ncbi:Signal transduction histidine-protein kinase ArlS [Clostridiales bacterium CHKCI001]|nr:Signal transduction histidine-protein kinase ArlS [Clostridiales bacterium CHKCI001]
MLKKLSHRLQVVFISTIMCIITIVMAILSYSQYQSEVGADKNYTQKMISFFVLELETESILPEQVLLNWGANEVSAILKDWYGNVLYENNANFPTNAKALSVTMNEMIAYFQTTSEASSIMEPLEIAGSHGDRYFGVTATIRAKSGQIYMLEIFYPKTSMWEVFTTHLVSYVVVWIASFLCVFLLSWFIIKRTLEPTKKILKSQKDFVAAASHELKSPLAVIMTNAEMIQDTIPQDNLQIQASLQTIDSECIRMSRLVRDMLLLASSDADKWTVQKAEVDLDTLLISLYEAYEPVCMKEKINLNLDLNKASFPKLYTDQERLFQILSVYMDNAIYYSLAGASIDICVSLSSKEVTISIVDHGSGVAEKDKPYIFDRFYCADKSRTDKTHFGLGLSIALELSKMLGGIVGFTDTAGGGATFYVTLPIK